MLYKKCNFNSKTNEYFESEWVQEEELTKLNKKEGVYEWFEDDSKKTYLLYSGTESDTNGYDGMQLMHVSSDSILSLIKYFIKNREYFRKNTSLDIYPFSEIEDIDHPNGQSFTIITKIDKI